MIIFCTIFFLYRNDQQISTEMKQPTDKPNKHFQEKKIRINRETYTIPAPCRDCPGENGQGVQLSVRFYKKKICLYGFEFF
jgi:hypothetical protein